MISVPNHRHIALELIYPCNQYAGHRIYPGFLMTADHIYFITQIPGQLHHNSMLPTFVHPAENQFDCPV